MFTLRENNKSENRVKLQNAKKCSFNFFVRKYNKLNREFTVSTNKRSALDAFSRQHPKTKYKHIIRNSRFVIASTTAFVFLNKCSFTFG